MTCIAAYYSEKCQGISSSDCSKTRCGLFCLDTLAAISLLVVGILGIYSVIGMPPAAAYALTAIGGAIPVIWILCGIGDAIYEECIKGNLYTVQRT